MKKIVLLLAFLLTFCNAQKKDTKVELVVSGADRLVSEQLNLIKGKTVGIVTNHTAVLKNGTHLVDSLHSLKSVNIKTLFGPEHGIRGDEPDGTKVKDGTDSKTGLPTVSLYGKIRKPTPEMLEGIDYMIFDIQDIGARFYTYISTLYNVMDACAENNVGVIVLDRPNPIGGIMVNGPLRIDSLKSFVAIAPVALQHGLTIGELATMFNDEGMLPDGKKADLTIVQMKNYNRKMFFDETGLNWIKPSPNMPNLDAAIMYPGLCLLEGTNISEGRGTYEPFLQMGAPFIDAVKLLEEMKKYPIEGLKIDTTSYTPVSIPNMSMYPKFPNKVCNGLKFQITDRTKFNALDFGIYLVSSVRKLYPDEFEFRRNWLDKLTGVTYVKEMIGKNESPEKIIAMWQDDVKQFKALRKNYLLYK